MDVFTRIVRFEVKSLLVNMKTDMSGEAPLKAVCMKGPRNNLKRRSSFVRVMLAY